MIDLHCHLLPHIDDGARDLATSLDMARAFVADGVEVVACTPHILPGVFHNEGPQIRHAVGDLQRCLDEAGIDLKLVAGADNHIVPDFMAGLKSGRLLSLADSRYVLVEPPHHVAPPRLAEFFFSLLVAGYAPILTHPERLTWIEAEYALVERLCESGVWMQVTAGSLAGGFGRKPRYWAERMLSEGRVHIVATDAHDTDRRRPELGRGRELAARWAGAVEAEHLVRIRPSQVLANEAPANVLMPAAFLADGEVMGGESDAGTGRDPGRVGIYRRLRRLFD